MNPSDSPLTLARLSTAEAGFETAFQRLKHWSADTDRAIESRVGDILADVRARGDAAVLDYTARFDGLKATSVGALEITRDELQAALAQITPAQRSALQAAADRIRAYHERQLDACGRSFAYRDAQGTLLGQKVTPLDRVGIYVPGGKAAYPSSLLMNAVPAHVAGVGEIIMVVPTPLRGSVATGGASAGEGAAGGLPERNPLVLAAAAVAGVSRAFTIGGAQAVAALAYGTQTIPQVDKITGPGNAYVASAKRRVFGTVGIDMIAGPSEILVIADGSTPPDWVAMDLFSQAEHDELAQSILLCPHVHYLDAVQAAMDRLLPTMPRREVIRASLQGRGALVLTRSMEEACELSNRIAPEHLEVSSADPHRWEPLLRHAGAIFLGEWTSESLGDYCAGPNHVLPTSGTARFSSPLGVYDFQKRSSLIEVSQAGARSLGPVAAELAHGEGLTAHARAAELRLQAPVPSEPGIVPDAPLAASRVVPVTEPLVDGMIRLKVAPVQEALVASAAASLAQAAYRPLGRPMAIVSGGEPVGLLLLWDSRHDRDDPADELYIWRLLVDYRHQRQGHGAVAVRWAVAEAQRLGVARLSLSHQSRPGHAGPFYEKLGFRYTGLEKDGELEMELRLR